MSKRRLALVVGSGGREHALARALIACGADVLVAPGSPGMACPRSPGTGSISIDGRDPEDIDADLVIVGPEVPLVDGLADRLRAGGRLVVGPGADGAQLEGSKAFMKDLLVEAGVPTARHWIVESADEAAQVLSSLTPPYVVKTDGLAAGKGVLVTDVLPDAIADATAKLAGRSFGHAGTTVVIEEGMVGEECSLIALCDGTRAVPFAPAQDFKRIRDGDLGPNTGGMGAYSPMPSIDDTAVGELMDVAVMPTLAALRRRGIDYRGLLYAGLMLTDSGPKVIEFNVRFGDPEAQVILPRLDDDLYELFRRAAAGELVAPPRFSARAAVTVVLAAPGYPGVPSTGMAIKGLGADGQLVDPIDGVTVFHAGVARPDPSGSFVVAGGRVLDVTALADDVGTARARAYEAADRIVFDGMQRREDIASRVPLQQEATR